MTEEKIIKMDEDTPIDETETTPIEEMSDSNAPTLKIISEKTKI